MSKTWEMVPLGNVLSERQEKPSEETLTSGKIRIVAKIGFDDGKIQLRVDAQTKTGMILIRPGDLVVSGINAAKGAIALYGEENLEPIAATIHYGAYTPQKNKINVKYLWWLLRSRAFLDILQEYVPGGIKTELKAKRLLPVPIPLPQLSEQERIVAKIEQLTAKIEEARGLRKHSDEIAEKFLGTLSTNLFESITNSHPIIPIGEIVSFRNDLIRPVDGKTGELRFIGLQHIESNTGKRIGEARLLAEELTGRKFKFSPNEIVYGYLRPYLNKVWIADCDGFCSVDQYVLRPKLEVVEVQYLAYFMRSNAFLKQSIELTHNLILPRLRTALLQGIIIPLPPLDEQRRIVAYLDGLQAQVDRLKALQAQTAAELEALLPSILDKAFKGEL